MGVGWAGMEGGSTKGVCPVHLEDGCPGVVGQRKLFSVVTGKKNCPRLVLEGAGTNTASLEFATRR